MTPADAPAPALAEALAKTIGDALCEKGPGLAIGGGVFEFVAQRLVDGPLVAQAAEIAALSQALAAETEARRAAERERDEARLEIERRGGRSCPFPGIDIEETEPCPVCGDLGTWDAENLERPSNCVSRPLPRAARTALSDKGGAHGR